MGTTLAVAAAAVVAGAAAACSSPGPSSHRSSSGSSTTQTTRAASATTTPPPNGVPAVGQYIDGASSQPHYVVDVSDSSASTLSGTVSFVYQDGRTSTVLTFSGTPQSGSAALTTAPGARVVDVTYTSDSIDLESCTEYLQYATNATACSFSYTGASPTTTDS